LDIFISLGDFISKQIGLLSEQVLSQVTDATPAPQPPLLADFRVIFS
jgi:hypothetical protein